MFMPKMNRQRWAILAFVATLYFLGGLLIGDLVENLKSQVPHPPSVDDVERAIERSD